jgi:alcohol dehydrogenase class IV
VACPLSRGPAAPEEASVETTFSVPPVVVFGAGALHALPVHARRLGIARALIVTDRFFAGNGLADRVAALLGEGGIATRVFADVQPDPTVANVQAGLAAFTEFEADALVAVGGGSPIDAAKAVSVLTRNPEPLSLYQGYHKVARQGAPVIAVPTTAGTGSEVTKVTVITDPALNLWVPQRIGRATGKSATPLATETLSTLPRPTAFIRGASLWRISASARWPAFDTA